MRITITPPFWRTLWFRLLGALFALGSLATMYRLRVRSRIQRSLEIDRARRSEAETVRRKAASDFHDELGHRLTKIGLFAEIVKGQLLGASRETMSYLEKIIDDSRSLTNDTRDFIWTLDPGKDSLFDVVVHLKECGEELFDRSETTFVVSGLSEDLLRVKLPMDTRRHLTLIFKEGMNNILKHADCRNVALEVRVDTGTLEMCLTDDGKGYGVSTGASGYGLKSMMQRAEKIHSSIRFESQPGKGARIELRTRAPVTGPTV